MEITASDFLSPTELSTQGFSAVPGIPYMKGYSCSFPGCDHSCRSLTRMRRHQGKHGQSPHGHSWPDRPCTVQSLYSSNYRYYQVALLPTDDWDQPSTEDDPAKYLAAIYEGVVQKIQSSINLNDHDISPFLRRYRSWLDIVADVPTDTIKSWVSDPGRDEPALRGLGPLVDRYFAEITAKMSGVGAEAWTLPLRFINTAKG